MHDVVVIYVLLHSKRQAWTETVPALAEMSRVIPRETSPQDYLINPRLGVRYGKLESRKYKTNCVELKHGNTSF